MAVELDKTDGGKWRVKTDLDSVIEAPAICIAAGGGSFQPKKPPIPGVDEYEGKSVFYAVRRREMFKGKNIVIAGGGDSALDWTLNLEPIAEKITLVHRRPDFRAAPDSVEKMRALVDAKKIDLHIAQIKGLNGADGQIESVAVETKEGEAYDLPCDTMLAFYGLTMKLGPIAEFGLNLHENRVEVDTEKFETSVPRHILHRRHGVVSGQTETHPVRVSRIGADVSWRVSLCLPGQEAQVSAHDIRKRLAGKGWRKLARMSALHPVIAASEERRSKKRPAPLPITHPVMKILHGG